jgi:hypothetical protein
MTMLIYVDTSKQVAWLGYMARPSKGSCVRPTSDGAFVSTPLRNFVNSASTVQHPLMPDYPRTATLRCWIGSLQTLAPAIGMST